jgi:hypothetical protein
MNPHQLKENITMAVGLVSLVGMIAAWATIPHRVTTLEKRVEEHDRSRRSIEVIEERTKIMLQDIIYLRKRMDDIASAQKP